MEVTPRYKLLRGLRGVWFEQHGNRLYGVMGLLSKMSEVGGWSGYAQVCYNQGLTSRAF